jgi:hypothetical protein
MEVPDPQFSRVTTKKGGMSSRNAVYTQQSTLYSMNISAESPRGQGNVSPSYTPMMRNELSMSPRMTKTAQGKGQINKSAKKTKKATNLLDMVVIYADLGNKHLKQEAIAS